MKLIDRVRLGDRLLALVVVASVPLVAIAPSALLGPGRGGFVLRELMLGVQALLAIASAAYVVWRLAVVRRVRSVGRMACTSCGYDLRASGEAPCPECGYRAAAGVCAAWRSVWV